MVKQLTISDLGNNPVGFRVMGMTEDNVPFEGTIEEVICWRECEPALFSVEGSLYHGDQEAHFIEDLSITILKVYNEDEFNRVKELMMNHACAIESSKYYIKECEELLRCQ